MLLCSAVGCQCQYIHTCIELMKGKLHDYFTVKNECSGVTAAWGRRYGATLRWGQRLAAWTLRGGSVGAGLTRSGGGVEAA